MLKFNNKKILKSGILLKQCDYKLQGWKVYTKKYTLLFVYIIIRKDTVNQKNIDFAITKNKEIYNLKE